MCLFSNHLLYIYSVWGNSDTGNLDFKRKINIHILIEKDKEQSNNYKTLIMLSYQQGYITQVTWPHRRGPWSQSEAELLGRVVPQE